MIVPPAAAIVVRGPSVAPRFTLEHRPHHRRDSHPGPRTRRVVRPSGILPPGSAPAPAPALPRRAPSVVTALGVSLAKADRWRVLGGHGRNGVG